MAMSQGTAVNSGNEQNLNTNSFLGNLGNLVLSGLGKKIDQELISDGNNIPDQNDLVFGVSRSASKNSLGVSFDPKMLIVGGIALLLVVVVIKKVL